MNRTRIVNARGCHKDKDGNMVLSPYIVLGGKSLAKAGFSQGDKVEIKSEYGLVTVKLLKVDENELNCEKEDI